MVFWKSVVGKLWMTIMILVVIVLVILGMFLLEYIELNFSNSRDVKNLFYITGVIGFLLTTFFAFFLSTRITRPLLQLKEAADQVIKGKYNTRVNIRSTDEIGELSRTYNHMAEELERLIAALQHEKEHLSSVLRSMTDAVVSFDAKGNVMLANPQGERLVREWKQISWTEDQEDVVEWMDYQDIPDPLQAVFEAVVLGTSEQIANINVLNTVWSVVMTPLYDNGSIRGAVAVLRDVTEEYKLDKLRDDFVANVSHELRTPLSMLQGYSEALMDDIAASPDERQQLVQVIHDESLRMGRLVQDLLQLARTEPGRLQLNYGTVNLYDVLQRVCRKFHALAREKGIHMEMNLSSEELQISSGNEDHLEQVFTNLLDNAIRHTSPGKNIRLRTTQEQANDNSYIHVFVEDEGSGIPSEDLPYVFERFYKADKARTRANIGGTGLGLAIVKNIMDSHSGEVTVTSKVGEGTTFKVSLPV